METNILNGDALIERMEAAGFQPLIVCRECLIDGPADGKTIAEFWHQRSQFIADSLEAEREMYYDHVVTEYDKLRDIPADSKINLWFGDDLFCQANLWFTVSYLHELGLSRSLYRVFPIIKKEEEHWNEFGNLTPDELRHSYDARVPFSDKEVSLTRHLWQAYSRNDLEHLQLLSTTPSNVFQDLDKVVQAHIDRFAKPGELSRPERTLKEIIESGETDFSKIFPAFFRREGIYGFGDIQVKNLLANIK